MNQLSMTRSAPRPRHRRIRGAKPAFVMQPRDMDILRAVATSRFLTRPLITRLFPADPSRVPVAAIAAAKARHVAQHPGHRFSAQPGTNIDRRLAKLFHHGFLDRLRTVRGGELVYALTWKGALELNCAERKEGVPELSTAERDHRRRAWIEKNRVRDAYIEHTLMVARFRVTLLEALRGTDTVWLRHFERESDDLRVVWEVSPHTLAQVCRERHVDRARMVVNPDAYFTLAEADRPGFRHFFLEADRSSAGRPRMLEKYTHYSRLYLDRAHEAAFGITNFLVLTVTRSATRALNLLNLVAESKAEIPAGCRSLFLFTSEETYAQASSNLFAATWRSADRPEDVRALVASPLKRLGGDI